LKINWYISGHASFLTTKVKDIDHDQIQEIVVAGFQNDGTQDRGTRYVLQYNKTGFIEEEEELWKVGVSVREADFSDGMDLGDIDGDGILDMVSGGRYKQSPPAGTFLRVSSFLYPIPTYRNMTDDAPVTYASGKTYNFSIQWRDQEADLDTVILEFDGTNYTVANESTKHTVGYIWHNKSLTDLPAGTHNYTWYANGSRWNSSSEQTFIIDKAPTQSRTFLDGAESDKTYEYGDSINLTGTVNVSSLTVKLDLNATGYGANFESGTGSATNITDSDNLGQKVYNFTVHFNGNENYTASSQTHHIYFLNETPTLKAWDDQVKVGENVSVYYNVSVENPGTTQFSDTVGLSEHVSPFWINTSSESKSLTIGAGSTKYPIVNCTNVTVRETEGTQTKKHLSNYDKYIWNATLTVYENDVTPNLPVNYSISEQHLPYWDSDKIEMTKTLVDQSGEDVTVEDLENYVDIIIGTDHGFSSLSEGDHPAKLMWWKRYKATGGGAPAPEAPEYHTVRWLLNPSPQNVTIYKDGKEFLSERPMETNSSFELKPGEYKFKFEREGYRPYIQEMTVNKNITAKSSLEKKAVSQKQKTPTGGFIFSPTWILVAIAIVVIYLLMGDIILKKIREVVVWARSKMKK